MLYDVQSLGEKSCNGRYTLTHTAATNRQRNSLFAYLCMEKIAVIWSLGDLLSRFIDLWRPWVPNRDWDPWGCSLLPAPLPSQIRKREPCRETAAAMGPLEEKLHQMCSTSRHQDGFPQPVSGCRSWVHAALMSRAPQNAEGRLLGEGNAAPLCAALPAHLCSCLDGTSLLDYFFHHAFLISLRGVINQVTQEWQSFPGTRRYHSKGWSRCSAWCRCVPSLLELTDGSCSESAAPWGSRQDAACSAQWEMKRI